MEAPIETLFVIAEAKQRKNILKILTTNNMPEKIILSGKGTAKSAIEDIFGFGIIDKDVIVSFVDCDKSEKVCTKLHKAINGKGNQGIVFTVPLDAISSDLFKFAYGGNNGKEN